MLLAGAESVSRSIIGKAGDFSLSKSGKSLKQSYKLMVEYLLNIVIFKALQFFFLYSSKPIWLLTESLYQNLPFTLAFLT